MKALVAALISLSVWVSVASSAVRTPAPTSPSGLMESAYPVFHWTNVVSDATNLTDATWYQIWINRDGVYHWSEWIEGAVVWTPWWDMQEYPGSYEWWVQGWNTTDGYGAWSSNMTFVVNVIPSRFYGSYTGTVVGSQGTSSISQSVTVTFGGDAGLKSQAGYLYVPDSDGSAQIYTGTEGGFSFTRTITIDGSDVNIETSASSGKVSRTSSALYSFADGFQTVDLALTGEDSVIGEFAWQATLTRTSAVPGACVLISPSNAVTDASVRLRWTAVADASWYQVWLNKDDAYHWSEWVQSSTTWTSWWNVQEFPGNYEWWVQTWGDKGYGPWSDSLTFQVGIPGLATPLSPTGTVTAAYPVFLWEPVTNAVWYQLWLNRTDEPFWTLWTQATAVTSDWNILEYPGYYEWWVQTWGTNGYGPWSGSKTFLVGVPGPTTLSSPSGTTSLSYPLFRWSEVSGATWYRIWLEKDGVYHWSEWVEGREWWMPDWNMQSYPGSYEWWVQTWGEDGYGPWSESLTFEIE